jgi:hypothetical protein
MSTQINAIQLTAAQAQTVVPVELDALISLLLDLPCRRQVCAGKHLLREVKHHGQQHKIVLDCGLCHKTLIFQTHRETGLVRVRLPNVGHEMELSLQRIVATILALMTGHSQRALTYVTHAHDGGFTRPTADRYMKLLCPAVVEAAKTNLQTTRVDFRRNLGAQGKYSASFDCGWRTRGAHAYGGTGDIISFPRTAGERPVRLASAVLQRRHLIRVMYSDGSKREVVIGADNHDGTSRGMEGEAFNLCLDDLKVSSFCALSDAPGE